MTWKPANNKYGNGGGVMMRGGIDWEPDPEEIPTDARQDYLDKIEREKEFITKHPSYISLCEQAQARIKFYQKRIAELDRMDKEVERMVGQLVAIVKDGNVITAAFDLADVDETREFEFGSTKWFNSLPEIPF